MRQTLDTFKHPFKQSSLRWLICSVMLSAVVFALPRPALANSVDQCISDAAKQAYECGKNVAEVSIAGAGVIEKGLAFLAQYPNCVNDVINLNWITIGISGAITTLGATGLLPTNSQAACEGGIYTVAAKPIAKGVSSLGIPGSSALQPYIEGNLVDGFKAVAAGIPIPSVGAPNLAAQFECGCAIPVMGAAVMEDIRKGIQAAKGAAKNCSAMAGTLYKCGKQAVMAVLTDPAGAVGSAGGWVADKVDDAYDYITGGCQNPPVEEYFSKTFAPAVSNVAYSDAKNNTGAQYAESATGLRNQCVKFFDDCNSTAKTAARQCDAMRDGVVQTDGNGWMVGRGFYQLVRSRQFEYEISRSLYEKAGDLHAQAKQAAEHRAQTIPQEVMPILSPGSSKDSIISRQQLLVDQALGINYSGLVGSQGLPAAGNKMSWQGGTLGFLMSQRATEVGQEGNGTAPASASPRTRSQALAQEYIDAFKPTEIAAAKMEGEYRERLRKYLTASGQQCVAVGDVFTCPKKAAYDICEKAKDVVQPAVQCELDWKKAAQLILKDEKNCSVSDANAANYACSTIAATDSCRKTFDTLGQSGPAYCSLNLDQMMADASCTKQSNKYSCDTIKGSDLCEAGAVYSGKNVKATCDIDVNKAMTKVPECKAFNAGSGPIALKAYQCSTYWSQDDCKAIHKEASDKTDTSLFCSVDVASADKAAGERSSLALSTPANACTFQGAVVTCPRDVQHARCKSQPYLKGCQLKRSPQYESLVQLAQTIRGQLAQGVNKKASSAGQTPLMIATAAPALRKAGEFDVGPFAFLPSNDPLYLDAVNKIVVLSYIDEVLKSHHPQMKTLQFCKGGEKTDPDGVDQLMICAPGLSEAFNDWVKEKAKDVNDKTQTAPPGGGKGPAALIAARVDARINPADIAKGSAALETKGLSAQGQIAGGAGVRNAAGPGGNVGLGAMGAQAAQGINAADLNAGNTGALAAGQLPGGVPAGAGGTQQVMMGQAPQSGGAGRSAGLPALPGMQAAAPNPPAAGLPMLPGLVAPRSNETTPRNAPPAPGATPVPTTPTADAGGARAPSPPATAPVATANLSPDQQLRAAACTHANLGRGQAMPSTPPVDGAFSCPAGAALTLCASLQRSHPSLVKSCQSAARR